MRPFDIGFLNAEFARCGHPPLSMSRVIDTLPLARQKYPGAPANLDALCRRFGVNNSHRNLHGALIDADLLASVFVELKGGRQPDLQLYDGSENDHRERFICSMKQICLDLFCASALCDLRVHLQFLMMKGMRTRGPVGEDGQPESGCAAFIHCFHVFFFLSIWKIISKKATKSIGLRLSGKKPPSRVISDMIARANGNSNRGPSVIISG